MELDALNRFLQQHHFTDEIQAIEPCRGGYSNLTYLLHGQQQRYILRQPPAGAKNIKGGHDMAREYQLLVKLQAAGFQHIPTPLLLGTESDFLGVPFYVMSFVEGYILRPENAAPLIAELNETLMRKRAENLCDTLANLHAIPITTTGLDSIGKPEGYVNRQVEGWIGRYEKAQTHEVEQMTAVMAWLRHELPTSQEATLLHNDFKYDNVVFRDEQSAEIVALLDWEMATVGDPLMDVGTSLSYWASPQDVEFLRRFNLSWLPGNLDKEEFLKRYAEKSGRNVENILFYYVFGLFKNAVVIQQIFSRYKAGLTTDERFKTLDKGVALLINKAFESIRLGRMV